MTTPASILIVDDEPQNRRLLQVLLGPEGYVTRTAASGEEALACIADDPPDLILLDVMMPGLDGNQVATEVKADPATRSVPIIMVTARSDHEARLAALAAGAEEFLTKPFDRAELWLRVRNLLRLKKLSDLLEQANEELQMVNESTRGFVDVAAHDLRSPLVSIGGYSTLLTNSWGTFSEQDRRKFVASIDRQSKIMSSLVEDLLTSSRIDGGGLNTSPELVVLGQAIDRCLELGSGDTASVAVSCSPDLVVRVDPHHLARILDNYVQNVFKYGEPPVSIDATRVGDMVEVRVLDHGPGVPPEFVPKLFGKFARADTPATRAKKGTGLGLSIVRGLAQANAGQVRYEPNVPNGSCFVVGLPAGDGPGA